MSWSSRSLESPDLAKMTSDRSIRLPMLLLLLLLLVYRPFVFGEQYFIEKPQLYQEVSAGHDVRLRCIVQNKGGTCHWQKDGKPVQVHLGKYEWDNRDNGDCTLTIKEANLHFDDGFWECQVTSSHFTRQDSLTSDKARLLVRGKNPIRFRYIFRFVMSASFIKVNIYPK